MAHGIASGLQTVANGLIETTTKRHQVEELCLVERLRHLWRHASGLGALRGVLAG